MNLENVTGYTLNNLGRRNVILGKNGCGKSHLLKQIEQHLRGSNAYGLVRYITPERAGYIIYEPGIERNIANDANWLPNDRRKNQTDQFKPQSVALFRILETTTLREIDADRSLPQFTAVIEKINSLLDRVEIRTSGAVFDILDRATQQKTSPQNISSGESELISLAIEMLAFEKQRDKTKQSFLLVDEPDVHLHPDLQDRLAKFIVNTFTDDKTTVVLATHSTALLNALSSDEHARVAFMRHGDKVLSFESVTPAYQNLLPIFGAHPLSNVFNERPALIIEGEDDERIWQQAVRSANGAISVFPCPVDGNSRLNEYEQDANRIIAAVYDTAIGYSLRDRDADPEVINDLGKIVRMRLACRSAENLMLTDEVLNLEDTNWETLEADIRSWVDDSANTDHRYYAEMAQFVRDGLNRRGADLKDIRNIILAFFSRKPWEVLVGQAIAKLAREGGPASPNSLRSYLGTKLCEHLLHLKN